MTDSLIERLRENVAEVPDTYWPGRMKEYAAEAADEIERLRAENAKLQVVVDTAKLVAHSLRQNNFVLAEHGIALIDTLAASETDGD